MLIPWRVIPIKLGKMSSPKRIPLNNLKRFKTKNNMKDRRRPFHTTVESCIGPIGGEGLMGDHPGVGAWWLWWLLTLGNLTCMEIYILEKR